MKRITDLWSFFFNCTAIYTSLKRYQAMRPNTLFFLFVISSNFIMAQAWLRLPDYTGTIRDDGIALVLGTKAYVGTGLDPISEMIDFKVFDLENGKWTDMQHMPHTTERQYACGFGNDTALFVTCGAGPTGALTSTWRYSITHQHWKAVASKPDKGVMAGACFQFGNKLILAGGKGNNDSINYRVWEYDIANNTWQQKNNFPYPPVWRGAYSTLNGYGYLFGGVDSVSRFSKRLYRYTPNTDQWQLYDSMPVSQGRAYNAMQGINNRLFMFGGFDSLKTFYNDAYSYDPQTKVWHTAPALPAAGRKGGMSFGYGQNFYYACGFLANGIRLKETWMTDVPMGIDKDVLTNNTVSLFPNPAQTSITLRFENEHQKIIQIFASNGSLVLESVCEGSMQQIDLLNLQPGIYFIKITSQTEPAKTLKFSLLPNNK